MTHMRVHESPRQRVVRATEWLDGKLLPIFGPPPLGPFEVEPPHTSVCPLCKLPLEQHRVEYDDIHTYLHCPGSSDVVETGRHH